jgi:hypothetical protein
VTKRLLVLLVLLAPALSSIPAFAQPVPPTWRPPTGSLSGEFLKWNGTAWVPSGVVPGTLTNSAGSNVVVKSNGTNLIASSVTDDGTTLATSDVLDVNNDLAKFGATDGSVYVYLDTINGDYTVNGLGSLAVNYHGYQNGTTQFRNVGFYDGKQAIGRWVGSHDHGERVRGLLVRLGDDQDVQRRTQCRGLDHG